jgi:hypothetical protein
VLRQKFGPKGDEVTGKWRRLHNKELYILYSGVQNKKDEMGGSRGTYGEHKGWLQAYVGET